MSFSRSLLSLHILYRFVEFLDDSFLRVDRFLALQGVSSTNRLFTNKHTSESAIPRTTRYFLPVRMASVTSPSCGESFEPVTKPPAS